MMMMMCIRRILWGWLVLGLCSGELSAQTTVDTLENALRDVKRVREQSEKATQEAFLTRLTGAATSGQAARALMKEVGMDLPDPEFPPDLPRTDTTLEQRREHQQKVAEAEARVGHIDRCLQAHFQLMRFGYQFATMQAGAVGNPEWESWIKSTASNYGTIRAFDLAGQEIGSSKVIRYFQVKELAGKPEAGWSLRQIPQLYREFILTPLREDKNPQLGQAWDQYIAMRSQEMRDADRWRDEEEPWLQFQKQADLFRIAPSDIKLTEIVNLIRRNPQHPRFEQMHGQATELLKVLRERRTTTAGGG